MTAPTSSPTASPSCRRARRAAGGRGSALVTVMMLSLALMILVAGLLGYSLNERRMNHRENMRLEARNAAEAVSEYGLAQIRELMQTISDFSPRRFVTTESVIKLPPTSVWGHGNVATTGANAPELIIGLVTPITQSAATNLYYYSATDPDNASDPLKGCYAFRFDIQLISKATVVPPTGGPGGPQTSYLTQTLSARASPLFSYAVFYNMDMEISPGPTMNIIGAVHANGSLYARKNSGNGAALNFIGPVSVSGGVYASVAKYPTTNADGGYDNMLGGTDNVYYSTAAGGLVGMKNTSSGLWQDQVWGTGVLPDPNSAVNQAKFRTWTSQTYQGNLQSSVHGIQASSPAGLPAYDPLTATPGSPNYDVGNGARAFIVPALMSTESGNHTMDGGYDANVEKQKYATRSGLYIVVNPSTTTRTGRMPNGSILDTDGTPFLVGPGKYRAFDINGNEVILPGQPDYGPGNAKNNKLKTNYNGGTAVLTIRSNEMTDLRRLKYTYTSNRSATNVATPRVLTTIDLDITELKKAVDRTINGMSQSLVYTTVAPTSGNWSTFIYNPSANPANTAITDANLITDTHQVLAPAWNGGVYIYSIDADQQPKNIDNLTDNPLFRNDTDPSGVRLINGRGRVASVTSPTADAEPGLTIATNDALYILGHFNADGKVVSTTTGTTNDGTSNSGRYYETNEQPCSVVSDATTVLSAPVYTNSSGTITQTGGWNDNLSMLRMNSSNWNASWRSIASSSSNQTDGDSAGPAGVGFTSAPTVGFSGGGGSGAKATATVVDGQIVDFTITSAGSNYTSVPTVTISGGGGSGPYSFTAKVTSKKVTDITINSSIPFVLPYDRASGLQPASTARTTKFGGPDTEISTAIMTGLVVSNKNGVRQASGGVHNFPRFLEDWDGTCAIRGSLVAMYESRVAYEPFSLRVYGPPTRLWGFNELFNQGHFPPLTPRTMSYRRVNFYDFSKTDYNALKSSWGL